MMPNNNITTAAAPKSGWPTTIATAGVAGVAFAMPVVE